MRTDRTHGLIEHRVQPDPRVPQTRDAIGKAGVRSIGHVARTSTITLLQYDGFDIFIADVGQGRFEVLHRQIDWARPIKSSPALSFAQCGPAYIPDPGEPGLQKSWSNPPNQSFSQNSTPKLSGAASPLSSQTDVLPNTTMPTRTGTIQLLPDPSGKHHPSRCRRSGRRPSSLWRRRCESSPRRC